MPHSRYERMQETPASFFVCGSALLSNPLSLCDIPLSGGMRQIAVATAGASGSSHRSSLRHGA